MFMLYMLLIAYRDFGPVPGPVDMEDTGRELTLLSLNVQQFGNDTQRVAEITRLIRECDPDIVCLQEFGLYYKWPDVQAVASDFSQRIALCYFDFQPTTGNIFGTAIFSKYPILAVDTVFQLIPQTNEAKIYHIAMPADTLLVCNAHLQSFNFANPREVDALTVNEVVQRQMQQAQRIAARLQGQRHAVVAGDMNAATGSAVYHVFSGWLCDALRAASLGWMPTHRLLPAQIDHVFATPAMHVENVDVIGAFPSDHRGLLVKWRW